MKDSKGHGSNGRGGSGRQTFIMPSRPYRQSDENTAHQRAIAGQHGVATDHLDSIRQSTRLRADGRGDAILDQAKSPAFGRLSVTR